MRSIDQAKYDIGQKVYAYDERRDEIIECCICEICIGKSDIFYSIEPDGTSMSTRGDYLRAPQEQLFIKKSEAIARAIKVKNRLLQDEIRKLGIYKLKKELEEELKKEEEGE